MTDSPGTDRGDVSSAAQQLIDADVLAFGGVGFAGQVLPPTAAYRILEDALPERSDEVRRELSRVLTDGSPAGKAYAATLLHRFDPVAARTAWESMTGDRSALSTFSGCMMDQTTLGAYATLQLAHRVR